MRPMTDAGGHLDAAGLAARSQAALHRALAGAFGHRLLDLPHLLAVDAHGPLRAHSRGVVLRPDDAVADDLLGFFAGGPGDGDVGVEDPWGRCALDRAGLVLRFELPVMVRPAGAPPATPERAGVEAGQVGGAADLAEAERTIVDGFPLRNAQPFAPGCLLPARVLDVPGVRVWLARVDGAPAAAMTTFDDGLCTGIYWLATWPALRGRGAARALLLAALGSDRPAVLTATRMGAPLYRSLGFETGAHARWWRLGRCCAARRTGS
jgi:GNAT superfamily N-acetyltransferase